MFERKIWDELVQWKKSLNVKKKALILKGLRQIGKTYIVREFASRNYKSVVYINFKTQLDMKDCFKNDLHADNLLMNISSKMPNIHLIPNETVLIFDEVQECSGARAAIKPLMEDGRFDVICTGSLLGIKGYNSKYSGGVSVGLEHTVYMKSMDFEEFLWAIGIQKKVVDMVKDCLTAKTPVNPSVHESFLKYFKEYICVGGLPAVVDVFCKTKDMNLVRREQLDIIESYKDDFGKHLDSNENETINKALLGKINRVFDSIPSQLAKENKKFMVSKIDKKSSMEKYEEAIRWLVDYGLISLCHNIHSPEFPLEGNKIDGMFKIYFSDSGLFVATLDPGTAGKILLGDLGTYKGAIFENIAADAFIKNGRKLYYFSKDSGLEIDFVTEYQTEITLIEVKAKDGNTKSSKEVLNNNIKYPEVHRLIRFKESNVGFVDNILTLPYYMVSFIG